MVEMRFEDFVNPPQVVDVPIEALPSYVLFDMVAAGDPEAIAYVKRLLAEAKT